MGYQVAPSKNDFLLYTVMNLAGYNDNNGVRKLHPLREATRSHFAREINNEAVLRFGEELRRRHMRSYAFGDEGDELICMERSIEREGPRDPEKTSEVLSMLQRFRQSTDYDEFFDGLVLPVYERDCEVCKENLDSVPLIETLDNVWEIEPKLDTIIVPRPLDAPWRGYGPLVGNKAVTYLGPGYDSKENRFSYNFPCTLHLAGHEIGHRYMKIIANEIGREAKKIGLADELDKFASKQRALDYQGETVLEETVMRAMQARYIDPIITGNNRVLEKLIDEHEDGFKHIFKFDEAIRRHKERPQGTLAHDLLIYMAHTKFED